MIKFVPKPTTTWRDSAVSVGTAVVLTLVISLIVLALTAKQPIEALWQMITYPYQGGTVVVQWGKALNKAAYLAVIAMGLSIGYRANVWNIGAEGQFALGGIGAFGAWLAFGQPDSALFLPVLLLGGIIGGMLWASVPAALRTLANTNELLVSLMMVYIGGAMLFYLSNGPWEGPVEYSPPQSTKLPESLQIDALVQVAAKLHWGVILAGIVCAVLGLIILFTLLGYRLAVAEQTPKAERFAGFNPKVTVWIAFLVSGGLAGLMGAIYLSADIGYLTEESNFLQGFGFTAIVIAFLGRLHPIGIILAALFIGYVSGGATWVQANLKEDDSIAGYVEVIALFCTLATAVMVNHRIQLPWLNGLGGSGKTAQKAEAS